MLKSITMAIVTLSLAPIISFADTTAGYAEPSSVEVGVGVGDDGSYGRGHHRSVYACYAQDYFGRSFSARGRNPRRTQRQAVQSCYNYSDSCRPLGCERIR